MPVRVSLTDLEMAWRAVDEAVRSGRGALERTAIAYDVRRAVVMAAVNRVEAAMGGVGFFQVQVRRAGALTEAGIAFHRKAPRLLRAWRELAPENIS